MTMFNLSKINKDEVVREFMERKLNKQLSKDELDMYKELYYFGFSDGMYHVQDNVDYEDFLFYDLFDHH